MSRCLINSENRPEIYMQDRYSSGTELPLPGIWHNLADLEGLSVHLARNVMRQRLSNLIKPVLGGRGGGGRFC